MTRVSPERGDRSADRPAFVLLEDGAVFPFHCVSIADGSRTIEQGAAVSFATLLKLGRHEAADIRPA